MLIYNKNKTVGNKAFTLKQNCYTKVYELKRKKATQRNIFVYALCHI